MKTREAEALKNEKAEAEYKLLYIYVFTCRLGHIYENFIYIYVFLDWNGLEIKLLPGMPGSELHD